MELQRNLKLKIAYDGHDFAGWQIQPDRATIQGTLVSVIEHITGEKTLPQGSGRTDAGVHALAQVATVRLESPIPIGNLRKALNDVLPPAIRILAAEQVAEDFHARKSAKAKTYRYRIYPREICSPFVARYVYHDLAGWLGKPTVLRIRGGGPLVGCLLGDLLLDLVKTLHRSDQSVVFQKHVLDKPVRTRAGKATIGAR